MPLPYGEYAPSKEQEKNARKLQGGAQDIEEVPHRMEPLHFAPEREEDDAARVGDAAAKEQP